MQDKESDPDSNHRCNPDQRADNQTFVNVPHSKTLILTGLGVRPSCCKGICEQEREPEDTREFHFLVSVHDTSRRSPTGSPMDRGFWPND
jgi:hypothetical protein